tara:strand:- start:2695 stop:3654 length:960 start_codon:yes stop_codon:yes gene_type:complete
MSKLVVNQIQYSGGTAFTLPQSGGTANQVMKTDGSGNLSFVNGISTVKNSGQTVTYTMPTAPGSANQVIKTNGSGQLSYANSTASNPMSVGSQDGMVLVGSTGDAMAANNSNTVDLIVPSTYTTNYTDIVSFRLTFHGIRASSSGKIYFIPLKQDGSTALNSSGFGGNYRWNYYSYGAHPNYGVNGLLNQEPTSNTNGFCSVPTSYNTYGDNQQDNRLETGSSGQYAVGQNGEFDIYPMLRNLSMNGWSGGAYGSSTSNMEYHKFPAPQKSSNAYTSSTTNGDMENMDGGMMGVRIYTNGGNWRQGVIQLYAIFKDGVV